MTDEPTLATALAIRSLKGAPASFKAAAFALLKAKNGAINVTLPDRRVFRFDQGRPGPAADLVLHSYNVPKRALAGGDVGFAESYIDGEWSTPDLTSVLRFFSANFDASGKMFVGGSMIRLINSIRHFFNRNSRAGAKRNIIAHYDLGNEFYAAWLDPTMTYSSAVFSGPENSLEKAQTRKYEKICQALDARETSNLLEIGCGWGGFAEHAAKTRGSTVTCLTLSPSQQEFAKKRMFEEGLSEKVEIRLEDYRDHEGAYDGVASIEMFEAVGEEYWDTYFDKIRESLRRDGRAALQIITIADALFPKYRKRADFIQRYIFPGGMLPSIEVLKGCFGKAGLTLETQELFGEDYARTCAEWRHSFNAAWPKIARMSFDEPFKRMWNFYLSYCEAGFSDGRINVGQYQLAKS